MVYNFICYIFVLNLRYKRTNKDMEKSKTDFTFMCNYDIEHNRDIFREHFKKGDFITILYDTRKCIVNLKSNYVSRDNNISVKFGLDANKTLHFNTTFGIGGNNVRYSTDEEINEVIASFGVNVFDYPMSFVSDNNPELKDFNAGDFITTIFMCRGQMCKAIALLKEKPGEKGNDCLKVIYGINGDGVLKKNGTFGLQYNMSFRFSTEDEIKELQEKILKANIGRRRVVKRSIQIVEEVTYD